MDKSEGLDCKRWVIVIDLTDSHFTGIPLKPSLTLEMLKLVKSNNCRAIYKPL